MKPNILGLRTCGYVVPDIEKAKEWYTRAFGVEPYFDQPFYVGYNIGGYELGLIPAEHKVTTGDTVLTYWGVDEVQPVYDAFLALGASSYEEPHNVGGEIVVAAVKDPWNNIIGFIYNPEFTLL